ncbi:MAG TPA: SpoVG family protein [Pirellulales bacterium]|nr:SpoVG family protein [Pirellulales bacterium]
MEITEVRIKLMEEGGERLQAFCSITFDNCFVIRDLKIIDGANGPFVAMPSRKLTSHCPQCGSKNHLRAAYCNDCGQKLNPNRAPLDEEGRAKLYADIAHPINSACREMIQDRVITEFLQEQERAKQPGYVSRYDDFDVDDLIPARHSRPARSHPTTSYGRPMHKSSHAPVGERSGRPHMKSISPAGMPTKVSGIDGHAAADNKPAAESQRVADDDASSQPKASGFGDGVF